MPYMLYIIIERKEKIINEIAQLCNFAYSTLRVQAWSFLEQCVCVCSV